MVTEAFQARTSALPDGSLRRMIHLTGRAWLIDEQKGTPDDNDMRTTTVRKPPETVDDYIAKQPPKVRTILARLRRIVRRAAPGARESISYRIPTFTLNGRLVYFAAFRNHIGLYPPVHGNAALERAVASYANDKGNLRFPLDRPMPYALIERIVRFKVAQNTNRTPPNRKR